MCPPFTVEPAMPAWGDAVRLVPFAGLTFGRQAGKVFLRGGVPPVAPGDELAVESWRETEVVARLPSTEPRFGAPYLLALQMQVLGATQECVQAVTILPAVPVRVLVLRELRCCETESWFASDLPVLRVEAVSGARVPAVPAPPANPRGLPLELAWEMDEGDKARLDIVLPFSTSVSLKLLDQDRVLPADGDDDLGELILEADGEWAPGLRTHAFTGDGAYYELDYEVGEVVPTSGRAAPPRIVVPATPARGTG